MRQNPNSGFGALGGGGGFNTNQSAFMSIGNGMNKQPSNTASLSKTNSAFNYGNLYSYFVKPNNDYTDLLQRYT